MPEPSLTLSDTETLAARVRALEDERAILATLNAYIHALDYKGRAAEFADCFTETGGFVVVDTSGEQTYELTGRPALTTWHEDLHAKPLFAHHAHALLNTTISLAGDEATAESYYVVFVSTDSGAGTLSSGLYTDRLVRSPDAQWRIDKRTITVIMMPPDVTP
jgi:hypothetical protein